ncbi:hypothetical protein CKM354_000615900 [Cercospora kikuchii]|uniref:Uncharacterized protein n=1 Tax=Cercospora kikuchii TaxID=84275 RepID=A0A9P3CHL8_9PEZI|nr:uncharacterized protein CKM354_000615900 [Cercospora kikuchii]GIZ42911.1 hypothetical protein CKM354_000615900 [Cercospora kikuchii]
MAEDESKASKASRFLKKSKWGKVLKEREPSEDDQHAAPHQGTFTLNNDVVDFLKPSTEKSKPRLDIAIAKRWPEAHQVRAMGEESPVPDRPTFTKPKRRKGLTVGFAKTQPEIIGEGGDEAPDPPREIGRRKAAMARSVSDARPGPRSPPLSQGGFGHTREPSLPHAAEEDFVPPPVRRVNTSHNELSAPMSRKFASPPAEDVLPHRPSIGRVPTGFDNLETQHTTPLETPVTPHIALSEHSDSTQARPTQLPPRQPPSLLDTRNHLIGAMSDDATSPVVQKRREINRNEGMAFRRASMLIHRNSEEDDEDAASSNQRQSKASSATTQDMLLSPSDYGQSPPESTVSPEAPNPFADPKYLKRISGEVTPAQPPQSQPEAQSLRQDRSQREFNRTQAPQPPPRSPLRGVPQIAQPRPSHSRETSREENLRPRQTQQSSVAPAQYSPQPGMNVPSSRADEGSRSPGLRDRLFNSSSSTQQAPAMFSKPNASSSSVNHFSPRSSHSRPGSRDGDASQSKLSIDAGARRSQSPRSNNGPPSGGSPRASLLGPGRTGPSPGPSPLHRPHDYFAAPTIPPTSKSPAAVLRQEENSRPASAGSAHSLGRPSASSQASSENNPAAEAAFADFAARVAHMKGVFRLTAEKELPADRCTPSMWLRGALWWYHTGKTGLEALFARKDPNDHRELLTQPHVDLAKAWWIATDPLEMYDSPDADERASEAESRIVRRGLAALKNSLKSLSLSIAKNHLLPPEASLIQGQNTRIWVDYPRFTSDAAAVLGGSVSKSVIIEEPKHAIDPYELLPLNDTREFFWYGRFPVEVYLNTEDLETDRVVLPCLLTVLRGKQDYQTSIVIASQNDLVNIKILPRQDTKRVLTWSDVSWQASSFGISIHLPRNFDLSVRMHERDFRALWNLSEYARKVEKTLRPEADERMVHESRLVQLQYVDSSNSSSFPTEKIRGCSVFIFEHLAKHVDGSGARRVHRGFRMLLITEPGHKTLSAVSHEICKDSPFFFEMLTDSAAGGTTAMVVRIRETKRQCRMLFVFPDAGTRQALYDVINGLAVGPDEDIVGKMSLASLNIEPASQSLSFAQSAHPALQNLQWQKLGITNGVSDDDSGRPPTTVQSESLRILARHATGCITDRLNLGKGELLLRFPPVESPSVQILREPQEDMTMSIDTRHSHPTVANGIAELLKLAREQPTIRTFTFQTHDDLHAFEYAITGCTVRFDGIAATLDISRRRMVVPIYKKWQAQNVRIQIVSQGQIVQLIAFMEEFSHADALCFQIKSTDVFENHKGDSKGKKWTVKLVDAKFTLPNREKGKEEPEEVHRKSRFVNLENLEYAEEHDDITIGFETEQDRDRFAQALPAAPSISRGITLKRRI